MPSSFWQAIRTCSTSLSLALSTNSRWMTLVNCISYSEFILRRICDLHDYDASMELYQNHFGAIQHEKFQTHWNPTRCKEQTNKAFGGGTWGIFAQNERNSLSKNGGVIDVHDGGDLAFAISVIS